MKSVMSHQFSKVPHADIQRSSFDRSHGLKTTFDAGQLVPIFTDEALPGDTFNLNMSSFARLATPLHPIMDNMNLDTFFFAVPIRLVWANWHKFNGEQANPADSTDYLLPEFSAATWAENSTGDHIGFPTGVSIAPTSIYHRAMHLIWNEWFRDENLQDSLTVDTGDGPDNPATYATVLTRGKRHDYFTSCLPWPQKGTSVDIPLGTTAPIVANGPMTGHTATDPTNRGVIVNTVATAGMHLNGYASAADGFIFDGGIHADLTGATAATINQLRQAFQIQRLYERDARGGTRYTEIIRAHFGVTSPDQRLQRPEYLGGGSSNFNVNPIAQTSSTDATSPQGNLAAMGTNSIQGHGFTKSFTEHCLIIGFANVRADLTYQQGLERRFSRSTRWDFYWPALANIGEQAVLNKEIYTQGTGADDNVFGYQERYAEYRYKPSIITGAFRSNAATSLDTWHLSQDFASLPALNSTFITDNPPVARVIAVPTEPHILFDAYFQLNCARPMPTYGVPGMIDHF